MKTPEQRDELSSEELSRLLRAAVEPLRPSPEAYQRIRDGVERRSRWRAPLYAAGGAVLAGIIVLVALVVRPSPQSHVVEVAPPVSLSGGTQPATATGSSHPTNRPRSNTPAVPNQSSSPGGSQSPPTSGGSTPTGPGSSPSATRSDSGSLTRPTPVAWPAKTGDIDGDGLADTVEPNGTSALVRLSRGGTVRVPLGNGSTAGPSTAVDLDDDGFAELIIQTGKSAGVSQYRVARYAALGEMSLLSAPSTGPLEAGTEGSSAGWGFACVPNGIQFVAGTSSDGGQTYQVTTTTLKPTFDGWAQQGTAATRTLSAADAALLFTAHCGSLG